jgi:hypothetical protein
MSYARNASHTSRALARLALPILTALLACACPGPVEEDNADPGADMGTDLGGPELCTGEGLLAEGEKGDTRCSDGALYLCDGTEWVQSDRTCMTSASLDLRDLSIARVVSGGEGEETQSYFEMNVRVFNDGDFQLGSVICSWTLTRADTDALLDDGTFEPVNPDADGTLDRTEDLALTAEWRPDEAPTSDITYTVDCQAVDPDNTVVYATESFVRPR